MSANFTFEINVQNIQTEHGSGVVNATMKALVNESGKDHFKSSKASSLIFKDYETAINSVPDVVRELIKYADFSNSLPAGIA